jgi:hypothetical protein
LSGAAVGALCAGVVNLYLQRQNWKQQKLEQAAAATQSAERWLREARSAIFRGPLRVLFDRVRIVHEGLARSPRPFKPPEWMDGQVTTLERDCVAASAEDAEMVGALYGHWYKVKDLYADWLEHLSEIERLNEAVRKTQDRYADAYTEVQEPAGEERRQVLEQASGSWVRGQVEELTQMATILKAYDNFLRRELADERA